MRQVQLDSTALYDAILRIAAYEQSLAGSQNAAQHVELNHCCWLRLHAEEFLQNSENSAPSVGHFNQWLLDHKRQVVSSISTDKGLDSPMKKVAAEMIRMRIEWAIHMLPLFCKDTLNLSS